MTTYYGILQTWKRTTDRRVTMATAGVGSNKESQIKYLRAQAEYDFAWTKYFDEICETIENYNGKQATKRIDTALKKINKAISFEVEKDNRGSGYIYIGWYDYDGRIWNNDTGDEWAYLRTNDNKYHIIMARIEDMYCIDANSIIEQITNAKNRATDNYNETIEALNNFDALKEEYNNAVKTLKELNSNLPYIIRDRYDLDAYNVYEWGNYFRGQLTNANIIGTGVSSPYFFVQSLEYIILVLYAI